MKKIRYAALALVIIAVLAFITKPSEKVCKFKTAQQIKSGLEKKTGKTPDDMMMRIIEMATENGITITDKGLYRKIYFRVGNEDRAIGWGAFGMVHTNENY